MPENPNVLSRGGRRSTNKRLNEIDEKILSTRDEKTKDHFLNLKYNLIRKKVNHDCVNKMKSLTEHLQVPTGFLVSVPKLEIESLQ